MPKSTQVLTLTKAANLLKKEKISFSKLGNFITAQKKKTTKSGQTFVVRLALEKNSDERIIGHVLGYGTPLKGVEADQAIKAYTARLKDLKAE